jgi:hypothetical protein
MGEKLASNPVTGTGSMSEPLALSQNRSGFGAALLLSIDSGAGKGICLNTDRSATANISHLRRNAVRLHFNQSANSCSPLQKLKNLARKITAKSARSSFSCIRLRKSKWPRRGCCQTLQPEICHAPRT